MNGIIVLFQSLLADLLNWQMLLAVFLATSLGIIIGALPGLTATMGIALLTGVTYGMNTSLAVPVLMGVYVGAIYGGSISAVLINIPGTGSAAATALDGHPLAVKGEAWMALSSTRFASFLGTLFGIICLAFFAPLISKLAEKSFASPEYFMLALFGILICGSLCSQDKPIKGWIAGFIGLMISFVGMEEIHGYQRFVYGNSNLVGGISYVPAMIGLFSIPQVLDALKSDDTKAKVESVKAQAGTMKKTLQLTKNNLWNILRSGLIGVGIGSIPGAGEDIAAWMAYDRAKNSSKHPEEFGKGAYEGVIAAETGNNACIGGAIIPLLTLAVPGSPPAAVLLGALELHGIRCGPMLSFEQPTYIYEMSAVLIVCAIALLICGLLLSRVMVSVLRIDQKKLFPIVIALCVIGSYAINLNKFDLTIMFIMGLLGYVFNAMGYSPAALVLGIILGKTCDVNFRRALLGYSWTCFFTRIISLIFVVLVLVSLLSQFPFWKKMMRSLKQKLHLQRQSGAAADAE